MPDKIEFVLVTGATGFIGAHIVDCLLQRGFKVRATTRSQEKAQAMIKARPQHQGQLEFVQIGDFENPTGLTEAVKDVDAIIHTASPLTYDTKDNLKELILPAINGTKAMVSAAATNPKIQRIVMTSSFAAVLEIGRKGPPYFTYTGKDWNPLTYEEAADPSTDAVVAYRGSKKFAELAVWDFIEKEKPSFDMVALCPPMTFGPVVNAVSKVDQLSESNSMLWKVAMGQNPLPVSRVPFWIDVRDLAAAHVGALNIETFKSGRYIPAATERFTYGIAAQIMSEEFPQLKDKVTMEDQHVDESHGVDGETAAKDLGYSYRPFKETVVDIISQALGMSSKT